MRRTLSKRISLAVLHLSGHQKRDNNEQEMALEWAVKQAAIIHKQPRVVVALRGLVTFDLWWPGTTRPLYKKLASVLLRLSSLLSFTLSKHAQRSTCWYSGYFPSAPSVSRTTPACCRLSGCGPLLHLESWHQTRSRLRRSDRRRIARPRLAALQSRPSSSGRQKKGLSC